jgi:tripartite-type tricarboxylate transporter receptor subunit TctC
VTYASAGAGSTIHLASEFFKRQAGIDLLHVPYKGAAPAMTDLLGGQVDVMFAPAVASLPLAAAGKLRALAVTSAKRTALAPELPTIAERGLPGFEVSGWYGLAAPAATPAAAVARLNSETNRALESASMIAELRGQGSSRSAIRLRRPQPGSAPRSRAGSRSSATPASNRSSGGRAAGSARRGAQRNDGISAIASPSFRGSEAP